MGSMYSLLDGLFLICGIYILYLAYQMKFRKQIKEGILLPKDVNVKKCTDKSAYIKEMTSKTALYGIAVSVWGAVSLLNDQYQFLNETVYLIGIAVFLVFTGWFAYMTKKAYQKYWSQK